MTERSKLETAKHVVSNFANYTCNVGRNTALGALGGAAVCLLFPSKYTQTTIEPGVLQTFQNLFAGQTLVHPSYIVAAAVSAASMPVVFAIGNAAWKLYGSDKTKKSVLGNLIEAAGHLAVSAFIIKSISARLGFPMQGLEEALVKGWIVPGMTALTLQELYSTVIAPSEVVKAAPQPKVSKV